MRLLGLQRRLRTIQPSIHRDEPPGEQDDDEARSDKRDDHAPRAPLAGRGGSRPNDLIASDALLFHSPFQKAHRSARADVGSAARAESWIAGERLATRGAEPT
jgi:hypothetical protein